MKEKKKRRGGKKYIRLKGARPKKSSCGGMEICERAVSCVCSYEEDRKKGLRADHRLFVGKEAFVVEKRQEECGEDNVDCRGGALCLRSYISGGGGASRRSLWKLGSARKK